MWAQAKHLFDSGENWRFSGGVKDLVNQINARYEVENPVFGWLDEIIAASPGGSLATTDIIFELRTKDARGTDIGLSRDIASYMKARGFESQLAHVGIGPQGQRLARRAGIGVALKKM